MFVFASKANTSSIPSGVLVWRANLLTILRGILLADSLIGSVGTDKKLVLHFPFVQIMRVILPVTLCLLRGFNEIMRTSDEYFRDGA